MATENTRIVPTPGQIEEARHYLEELNDQFETAIRAALLMCNRVTNPKMWEEIQDTLRAGRGSTRSLEKWLLKVEGGRRELDRRSRP